MCDDDDVRAADWAERINDLDSGDVDARHLGSDEFAGVVADLKERKAFAKRDSSRAGESDLATVFDEADVLVLDSDLTPDPGSSQGESPSETVQQHLVGELGGEVAHLARCYSNAGALIVVNQKWKRRSFDLTMLTFSSEVAEVYVSETDLDNPGLWAAPAVSGGDAFRPWSWPLLADLPELIETLRATVTLGDKVLGVLGLDDGPILSAFTDRQLDALGIENWEEMTFADVATSSALGLRLKEKADEEQQLRIAVCAVRRWLDRHVLPSSNVLVDAPHLLQRRPWVVPDREDLASWNSADAWFTTPDGAAPALNPAPDAYAPHASAWLGRHVWLWPVASQEARAADQRILPTDPVFCEDTSSFVIADQAADFLSDLEGPSGQRFVRSLGDVDYHPRRRLLT